MFMNKDSNVIRLRYMGADNYGLGLKHGRVYMVSIDCKAGYITVIWNANECLYPTLKALNAEWMDA